MNKDELKKYYIEKCEYGQIPVKKVFWDIDTDVITTTEQIDEEING